MVLAALDAVGVVQARGRDPRLPGWLPHRIPDAGRRRDDVGLLAALLLISGTLATMAFRTYQRSISGRRDS